MRARSVRAATGIERQRRFERTRKNEGQRVPNRTLTPPPAGSPADDRAPRRPAPPASASDHSAVSGESPVTARRAAASTQVRESRPDPARSPEREIGVLVSERGELQTSLENTLGRIANLGVSQGMWEPHGPAPGPGSSTSSRAQLDGLPRSELRFSSPGLGELGAFRGPWG